MENKAKSSLMSQLSKHIDLSTVQEIPTPVEEETLSLESRVSRLELWQSSFTVTTDQKLLETKDFLELKSNEVLGKLDVQEENNERFKAFVKLALEN